jgi:hypothetical protein
MVEVAKGISMSPPKDNGTVVPAAEWIIPEKYNNFTPNPGFGGRLTASNLELVLDMPIFPNMHLSEILKLQARFDESKLDAESLDPNGGWLGPFREASYLMRKLRFPEDRPQTRDEANRIIKRLAYVLEPWLKPEEV